MYTVQFSITAIFPEGNYPFIIDGIGHLEMQLETDKRVFFRWNGRLAADSCRIKRYVGCRKN